MDPIQIGRTGLDVEWQRLQIIAQNLANMNSTRTETGDVYRPLSLLSAPDVSFTTMLGNRALLAGGVHVTGVEPQADGLRKTYEPENPHADADGFVTRPNVDHAKEMTLLISTSRAYEANLAMISIAQGMYGRALDMGRQT